ncbi:hypothetical protein PGT21_018711 [Puccinia graminis f. sp. tritici]|uniref:Uncharacterized protein n=1 Tax=Puccinia graminis f. sp. tritici TaxID=56615 RepID=A0A5B0LLU0_PUCGR|nr:hypothetical protein PGT21_018711 [Puccinia graminis f. sp. tritici]KAA1122761.1 hypothetical protein PGTUg99_005360 [Puccinia graminis f. sp. tritici]
MLRGRQPTCLDPQSRSSLLPSCAGTSSSQEHPRSASSRPTSRVVPKINTSPLRAQGEEGVQSTTCATSSEGTYVRVLAQSPSGATGQGKHGVVHRNNQKHVVAHRHGCTKVDSPKGITELPAVLLSQDFRQPRVQEIGFLSANEPRLLCDTCDPPP